MRSPLILVFLQLLGSVDLTLSQHVCPGLPNVPHASVSAESKKPLYHQGDVIYFTCETGYTSGLPIKYLCSNEGWFPMRKGQCRLKPCPLPDDIFNGQYEIIKGEDFVFGSVIRYYCNEGYHLVGRDTRTCMLNSWSDRVPVCEPVSCEPPQSLVGMTVNGLPGNDEPILPGRFLTFSCDADGQRVNGSSKIICGTDGQWSHPFPQCEDVTCNVKELTSNIRATDFPTNETVKVGHKIQFHCNPGLVLDGSREITCLKSGTWDSDFPTCRRSSGCGRPPTLIDGDTVGTIKNQYAQNEWVKYTCQNLYTMQGQPYKTCQNGRWTGEIRCLKPCTVNEDLMRSRNIEFAFKDDNKLYAPHLDHLTFKCVKDTIQDGTLNMRQQCNDGHMELPTCIRPRN